MIPSTPSQPHQHHHRHKKVNPNAWKSPKAKAKFVTSQTWRLAMTVIAPIFFLLIFMWHPPKKQELAPHALYVICLMATYWISECIPLAITSLLPVILLPLFGISASEDVCSVYFNNTIIFLFGGCVVALSFEYSNLHTRIAFFVMKYMGAEASILLFGMMMTCMVLSCWMNNTSTTAMMVPIVYVIMEQYKKKMLPKEDAETLAEMYGNPNAPAMVDSKTIAASEPSGAKGLSEEAAGNVDVEGDFAEIEAPKKKVSFSEMKEADEMEKSRTGPKDQTGLSRTGSQSTLGTTATEYWEDYIAEKEAYLKHLEVMFMVGVAFASNVGGTGVITGTGTNLIATNQLRTSKGEVADGKVPVNDQIGCTKTENQLWDLDFVRWIMLNIIPMIINVLLTWAFLAIYFQGFPRKIAVFWKTKVLKRRVSPLEWKHAQEKQEVSDSIKNAIGASYAQLGKTTLHEWLVLGLFGILVSLWIFRSPLFARGPSVPFVNTGSIPGDVLALVHPACTKKGAARKLESSWGWSRFFGDWCDEGFIHDSCLTLLVCILIFTLPKDPVYYKNILKGGLGAGIDDPIMPFSFVAEHMPWGPFFMLGGGFGISKAITDSKLNTVIIEAMSSSQALKDMEFKWLLLVLLFGVAILTSLASNTATAAIISPVLIQLAQVKGLPPLFILLPPIVSASYAFCLPISTPPNAIVYDKAKMKQTDMLVPGLFVTVITNTILYFWTLTGMYWMLGVADYKHECDLPPMSGKARAEIVMGSVSRCANVLANTI
ncbi:Solute carrier family 13 member 3 [Orchesella cincta]|uniref:Solute carrier family 13 member 3 n=1 Tax=Orchesella cincta TaxID=48709 RepID=A0A1D2N428_ORCCI|nr:Solute carrier family 13 member 3 [Orchesella cincta]